MFTLRMKVFKGINRLVFVWTGRKERKGKILFNDALNTFYLWLHGRKEGSILCLRLYGVGHMVKDHSDIERGNPLPHHGLLFLISSKGSFYKHYLKDRIAHTKTFVTPIMGHWLE